MVPFSRTVMRRRRACLLIIAAFRPWSWWASVGGRPPRAGCGRSVVGTSIHPPVPARAGDPVSTARRWTQSCFRARRGRAITTSSIPRPRPSIEAVTGASGRTCVTRGLVNRLARSVSKISGRPWRRSASSGAAKQTATSIVVDSRQDSPRRVARSVIATGWRKPRRFGMQAISAHRTWSGRSTVDPRSGHGHVGCSGRDTVLGGAGIRSAVPFAPSAAGHACARSCSPGPAGGAPSVGGRVEVLI